MSFSSSRQTSNDERIVKRFVLEVWPGGITHKDLADELERIAGQVRQGYYSGEVVAAQPSERMGWWDTITPID
jgi:hypothetical protein